MTADSSRRGEQTEKLGACVAGQVHAGVRRPMIAFWDGAAEGMMGGRMVLVVVMTVLCV